MTLRRPPLLAALLQRLRRHDSLLTRLLLAQLLLLAALAALLGGLFYAERNVTIARLYARHWAAPLAIAAGLVPPGQGALPGPAAERPLARPLDDRPLPAYRPWRWTPRFVALRQAFVEQGVPVTDLMLSVAAPPQPLVWLQVSPPGRPPQWWGLPAGPLVPEWSLRSLAVIALGAALLAALVWAWTRWLTRPLMALRERIEQPADGAGQAPGSAAASTWVLPEIAAIERAHQALLARLQQQERERTMLLAGVSHDLRSPLGRIRLAAELLPDEPALRPRRAAIVRNVAEADRLIGSFLDHVRAGELPLQESVDLADVLRRAAAAAERPAAELSVQAPPTLWRPHCHPLLVERLISNLLDNAFQHGRPPVRLTLAGRSDGSAVLEVCDAGDGIAEADLAQLQEAFVRGDRARQRPGSGLGLAIVRQITRRLAGGLTFERTDPRAPGGPGWCVRVTLPPPPAARGERL